MATERLRFKEYSPHDGPNGNFPFGPVGAGASRQFIAGFGDTFSEDSGGDPKAVLNWKDTATMVEQHAVIELRYVDASSPSFDADTQTLSYAVCGLKLDAPTTLMPLPDDQQKQPSAAPVAQGEFTLFIDPQHEGCSPHCEWINWIRPYL